LEGVLLSDLEEGQQRLEEADSGIELGRLPCIGGKGKLKWYIIFPDVAMYRQHEFSFCEEGG